MNAKQLRDSILQMAIQGKLVPQDPNEEPASELLKKIKAEKEQLIKDKKIKKDKNESTIFRGKDGLFYETIGEETKCIQEEIPFDIPNSWEWCRLYEIATKNIKRGKSPVYTEKSSIKVFAQKCNQKNGQINLDIALYLDETKLMKYDLSEFMEYGDTVINSTGGGTMGRVGFYDIKEPIKIVPDSHVTVIRTGVSTEKKYVYHYIKTKQVYLENYGDGSTNQKELKPETIMNLIVPLPPLAEQKRIVEEIDKLLPLVEDYGENEEALSKLQSEFPNKLRKSILQEAIQGKLVPQDPNDEPASELLKKIKAEKEQLIKDKKIKKDKNESTIFRGKDGLFYETIGDETKCIQEDIPFDIPDSWEWCRLSSIVSILGDGIHGTPEYDPLGDVFFINGNNLKNNAIVITSSTKKVNNKEAIKHYRELNDNSILVSINGTLGNVSFYNNEKIILGKSACYFNILRYVDKYFIKFLLESFYSKHYLIDSSTGTTIKNVPLSAMRTFKIPLPPLAEQKRIVEEIEKFYSKIALFDK